MLIPTTANIKTVTDMREDAIGLLETVNKLGLVYVFQHSNPSAIMLSLEEFQRLYDLIEDHMDELEAKRLHKEKRGKGIPLANILSQYKKRSSV